MSCDNAQARKDLEALFTGTLDGEGYTRLQQHVAGCASCRAEYERLSHVASVIEKRALPQAHQDAMEQALFTRLGVPRRARDDAETVAPAVVAARTREEKAAAPRRPGPVSRVWTRRAIPGALLAAGVALALVFIPNRLSRDDGWQARSGAKGETFGLRAFCVARDGKILGETGPGGSLTCPIGAYLQFAYTAPGPGKLLIEGPSPDLRFFPREGDGRVTAGVDVPIEFSTPVDAQWLKEPIDVRGHWSGEDGRVAISSVRIVPGR